ncbi:MULTISPECIES: ATP-binding cassette domain-containing protein [unclassified Beijerinckia]|uniref:ABC transporter ATP-binding protein n=1 Tax=unclassified Beijerinckia TaxID=2638183 RepID=UPI000898F6C9|nr:MULTISPECIES: ATP-binding cassette domain-containing protein [unclassified Beijerinckia]MDH7798904.1 branched-chain amino acid transport system ATP-binding protein [Beijerinckia sp. GAS462]SED87416.1 branched-chain amino acid transport system ATP-binding protein [Beijerinckia sp. 28-YEA-48]
MSAAAGVAISVKGLKKSFGSIEVIRGIDISFSHHERHLVIGPNGAGKTTFFNLLNGQYKPSAGQIEFLDVDVTCMSVRQRALLGLGRTFQIASLFQDLSVRDNLRIAAGAPQAGSRSGKSAEENAAHALQFCGLKADGAVRHLSYGEQRRLEIAMGLATAPKILLLDEPMAGLTQIERGVVAERIIELSASTGILLIEHDLEVALKLADRLTVLHLGQVVAHGAVAAVMEDPFVRKIYLG